MIEILLQMHNAMRIRPIGKNEKQCTMCFEPKPLTEFYPRKTRCRSCLTIVRRRYKHAPGR